MATGLAVLALIGGLGGFLTMRDRATLVADVTTRSGPLNVQAQDIYRSLSDADATAASAFLTGGVEPAAVRTRYLDDIAQATATLAVASRTASGASASALDVLTSQLPVYTGLVEVARTHNRQGLPLGAAYLREASTLMRQKLLPAAQQLYQVETTRLNTAQDDVATFGWPALLIGLAVVGCLVTAQVYLTRRTHRLVNRGLVAATALALVSLVWMSYAVGAAGGRVEVGRRDGSAQVHLLSEARIAALQARTDEALTLIARGDGRAFEADFVATTERLVARIAQASDQATTPTAGAIADAARKQTERWLSIHKRLRELDDTSRYDEAVTVAIGTAEDSAASAFNVLDGILLRGIEQAWEHFDRQGAHARSALWGADLVIALLACLTAAGIADGLYPRIMEYR
jgi:hypothetical protein